MEEKNSFFAFVNIYNFGVSIIDPVHSCSVLSIQVSSHYTHSSGILQKNWVNSFLCVSVYNSCACVCKSTGEKFYLRCKAVVFASGPSCTQRCRPLPLPLHLHYCCIMNCNTSAKQVKNILQCSVVKC